MSGRRDSCAGAQTLADGEGEGGGEQGDAAQAEILGTYGDGRIRGMQGGAASGESSG